MMKSIKYRERVLIQDAPIAKRCLAFLADLMIIDFLILWPFKESWQKLVGLDPAAIVAANESFINISLAMIAAIMIAYFAVLEWLVGQTPGKILFKLFVVSEGNKKPALWQCLARSIVLIPFFPFVILWIVDPLFMITRKQRFCEMLSRTRVVEARHGVV